MTEHPARALNRAVVADLTRNKAGKPKEDALHFEHVLFPAQGKQCGACRRIMTPKAIYYEIIINDAGGMMRALLTESLHQKLDAGCIVCQSWTYGWMDAHVCQHPNQLHQHVIPQARGRLAGRRDVFAPSSLVAVVEPQERVRAAAAPEELLPSLGDFSREVPEREEKSHDEVLRESSGQFVNTSVWVLYFYVATKPRTSKPKSPQSGFCSRS